MKKKNAQVKQTSAQKRFLITSIFGLLCLIAVGSLLPYVNRALQPFHDKLAYTVNDGSTTTLKLYDSSTGENRTLIEDFRGGHFNFSADGRIVYRDWDDEIRSIYMLDTAIKNSKPVNITPRLMDEVLLIYSNAWSPDGRYLAYRAQDAIYLWDGSTSIDITPKDVELESQLIGCSRTGISWGMDGRLAIRIAESCEQDAYTEIYIRDGEKTVNLSQNPTGYVGSSAWSPDGQFAFYLVATAGSASGFGMVCRMPMDCQIPIHLYSLTTIQILFHGHPIIA